MSADVETHPLSLYDLMAVDVPEGKLDGICVERFEVEANALENLRLMFQPGNRGCRPGTYTRLVDDTTNTFWMSDTTAERRDHIEAALAMKARGGHVLIGGLGLGMIVRAALLGTPVEHVEVLERDQRVIDLVGPHYRKMADEQGKALTIRRADARTWEPRKGANWSVVYFDIWPDLCEDNLPEMATLGRRYNRKRCDTFLCWGRELLRSERARNNRNGGWR